jgi:GNAT superfamily N-acetyltransferase
MEGKKFERGELQFKIETATSSDIEQILELNSKLFEYEASQGFDENLDTEWPKSEEANTEIRERVTSPESCAFLIKENDVAVGYLVGLILEEETGRADTRYAELEHMFIDENFRGKGVGEQLVRKFKEWAKEQGIKRIKVNVSFKNEKAVRFYEKVGLIPADITLVMDIE